MPEENEARSELYRQADELERAVRALPNSDPARGALIDQVNHLRFLLAQDESALLVRTASEDQRGADAHDQTSPPNS